MIWSYSKYFKAHIGWPWHSLLRKNLRGYLFLRTVHSSTVVVCQDIIAFLAIAGDDSVCFKAEC